MHTCFLLLNEIRMGTVDCLSFRPSSFSQSNHLVITKQINTEGRKEHTSLLLLSWSLFTTLNRGFLRKGRLVVVESECIVPAQRQCLLSDEGRN